MPDKGLGFTKICPTVRPINTGELAQIWSIWRVGLLAHRLHAAIPYVECIIIEQGPEHFSANPKP